MKKLTKDDYIQLSASLLTWGGLIAVSFSGIASFVSFTAAFALIVWQWFRLR